jgi:LytS/YehU family sensor histidine kinase
MVLSLMEELEITAEKEPARSPEMIIQISNFLNDFLPTGKEELIPLKSEIKLLEDFLVIHKQVLGTRLSSNFIVNGNLNPYVIPPLLLLPFINSAIKVAYKCNDSYESNVIIKAERNYLLLSFTFWSEQPFKINDKSNSKITRERLNYTFPGKYRLLENVDDNFKEISIEIFAKV